MSIELVDLGGGRPGSPVDPDTARTVDRACRELGFLCVVGHGVSDAIRDDALATAREFFELPLDARLEVAMPEPGYPYGYNPFSAEALERSLGTAGVADLKETFNVGPIDPPPRPLEQMTDPDERAVYAPNLWPAALPTLRPALERYYRAMSELSARLMEVFAVALGLPVDHFANLVDRHGSALRLAHYPALDRPPLPGQLRAGAHTDYGTLTVLATDGEPGLQVLDRSGSWLDVHHVPGAFVVNLGDLMERWTNDRWRSTMHRVVVPPGDTGRSRLSVPFFHNANWDARIECIRAPGEAARYPPVSAGAHLMSKFRSTVAATDRPEVHGPPVA